MSQRRRPISLRSRYSRASWHQRPVSGAVGEERRTELVRRVEDGLRVRLTSQGVTGVVFLEADYYDPKDYPPLPIAWTPKALYVPSGRSTVTVPA